MKTRAKTELVAMIVGMLMIIAGVFYFISKIRVTSTFFSSGENWPLWASILCLLPLAAGIVLMLIKRDRWYPRIISVVSAVGLIIVIARQTTLHLKTRMTTSQWVMLGILVIGGLLVVAATLFLKKREDHEKR